jgi:peptide/nickel transport system permease protein
MESQRSPHDNRRKLAFRGRDHPAGGETTRSQEVVQFLGRMFGNRVALLGAVIVSIMIFCALFAEWVAPYSPVKQDYRDRLLPPSVKYWLGTDSLGRDQLSRIIYGSRISLAVGFVSTTIGGVAGVALGLIAGFRGRLVDSVIMRAMDVLIAFPSLVLAIFLVTFLGPSAFNAIIAVGIVFIPSFARITRANVLSIREKEFVEAARALGLTDPHIMVRHVLPNCLSPIIVNATLAIGWAILTEAALSFLGLGVQPPTPTWGNMISEGRQFISDASWTTTFPGLAIFFTVLGFNFVGDGLREALDPRLRASRKAA